MSAQIQWGRVGWQCMNTYPGDLGVGTVGRVGEPATVGH